MDGEHKIFLNNRQVGIAVMKREGLYCHYKCTCTLPDKGIFRIIAKVADAKLNLGICVPKGDSWETQGRIPAKQLQGSDIKLIAEPCSVESRTFIPISSNGEFSHLDDLDKCQYAVKDGQPGVLLKK